MYRGIKFWMVGSLRNIHRMDRNSNFISFFSLRRYDLRSIVGLESHYELLLCFISFFLLIINSIFGLLFEIIVGH